MGKKKKKKESAGDPTLVELVESMLDDAAALSNVEALLSLSEALFKLSIAANQRKLGVEHRVAGYVDWALQHEQRSEEALKTAQKLLTE
jgi:hypothetical protein